MPQLAKNSNRLKDVSLDDVGVSFEENRLETVSLNTPSFSIPENQALDVPAVIDKSYKVSDISLEIGLPRSAIERWYRFLDEPQPVKLPIEDIVSAAPVKTPEGKPTYSGQLIGRTIEMATYLADMPRALVMFAGTLPAISGGLIGPTRTEGLTPEQVRASWVYRAAQVVSERAKTGKDFLLGQHPEWEQDPPESVMDMLKHPSKLAKTVLGALPLLIGAGFAVASGHGGAGMLLMFASEKGSAKTNFLSKGATEDEAERASNIYGIVATSIEYLQISQGLKIVGAARDIVLHRAAQKVASQAGKSLTKEIGITAVLESVEEMGQGTSEDLVGLLLLGQRIEGGVGGFVDRRAQEAIISSILSLASIGAGGALGIASKEAPVKKVPIKKEVAKFQTAVEARRGAIEKAMQEGRVKDASDLVHEAIVEATGVDTEAPVTPAPAEGVTVYHGTSLTNANKIRQEGFKLDRKEAQISLTTEKSVAEFHARKTARGKQQEVLAVSLKSDAKIFSVEDVPEEMKHRYVHPREIDTYARLNGYDGINIDALHKAGVVKSWAGQENEIIIFNPDVLTPAPAEGAKPAEQGKEAETRYERIDRQLANVPDEVLTSAEERRINRHETPWLISEAEYNLRYHAKAHAISRYGTDSEEHARIVAGAIRRGLEVSDIALETLTPEEIAEAESKAAWNKTKNEWELETVRRRNIESALSETRDQLGEDAGLGKYAASGKEGIYPAETHKTIVERAVREGKPVPRKVLEEYKGEPWADEALAKPAEQARGKEDTRDILGGIDPYHAMSVALKEAVAVRPKTEAEIRAGRKRQVAKATAIKEARIAKGDPVEDAILSAAGLKTGPLANYYNLWEPIRDRINESNPGAIEGAFLSIEQNKDLQYFEKRDTADAFRKLIDGESLTLRQVDLIKTQFGIELGDAAKAHAKKASLGEMAVAIWRAGLLTGIKTWGPVSINTLSNLGHGLTETAIDIPAAGVDSIASLFTGERTVVFTTRGQWTGAQEGAKKGWQYMKTGIDERHIAEKYEFERIYFGDSKVAKALQTYEETIFHLMGAEDQPFYYGAKARSLFSQAYAEGKTKGLKGKDLNDFADARVLQPSDDMLAAAVHDAEQAVFQNRTWIGDAFSAIHKSSLTGKILVPFSRTPSAVAVQIVNYSPAGAVLEVSKQIQKGEFEQRKFSRAMGRATIGTGALYIGTQLFSAGMMTLDYPDNEKERNLWEVEGRKSHSILVDGKWRSVETLGPIGSVLIVGGYFQRAMDKEGSPTKAMITAMAGAGKTFSDQTAIRGLSQAAKAISDPERSFENYFSGLAGSIVPTIVSDVARATDYTERRTTGPFERIVSRTPVARKTLEPKMDVYGQDLPRYGGNALEVMIDPSRPVKCRQDIVTDEVRRLWDKDIRVAPTKVGDRQGFKILTPEENTVLWRRTGDLVYKAVFSIITGQEDTQEIKYSNLSDEEKGRTIDLVVRKSQNLARAEVAMHKMSTGITLEELEADGLVTDDVVTIMYNMGAR